MSDMKMAFTNVIRRAVSSTIGATRSQRHYHHKSFSTLFSNSAPRNGALPQNLFRSSFSTVNEQVYDFNFSQFRESESELVELINSKIRDVGEYVPENFPFTIKYNHEERKLMLTREDDGETVTVVVHMPPILSGGSEYASPIRMDVTVAKQQTSFCITGWVGPRVKFDVSAYPHNIEIESLSIDGEADDTANRRPDFGDLDAHIREAFQEYLDSRGINLGMINMLLEHMKKKDNVKYVRWLKELRRCVEGQF